MEEGEEEKEEEAKEADLEDLGLDLEDLDFDKEEAKEADLDFDLGEGLDFDLGENLDLDKEEAKEDLEEDFLLHHHPCSLLLHLCSFRRRIRHRRGRQGKTPGAPCSGSDR